MGFVSKYRNEIIFCTIFITLYFLTRTFTLSQVPIFTDEAIYLRWAQYLQSDLKFWDYAVTDGKQPLFIWLMIPFLRIIEDPLIAGRMVSVFAGFVTMIGLFFLGREVFKSRWVGLLSSALYVIYPFALVYDRMALYDAVVGTFAVWGLYGSIYFIRNISLQNAMLLGVVTGAAVLNKTNGFFTIYMLPFLLLLFDWRVKNRVPRLIRFFAFAGVIVVMTYGIYYILRLSPYFYIITEKNAIFVYPVREWLSHPFLTIFSNTSALFDWLIHYFSLPFVVLVAYAFFYKERWREKLLLLGYFGAPLVALAFFGRTIYPRYIFFMTLSLLPLIAYSLRTLTLKRHTVVQMAIVFFSLIYPFYVSSYLLFDFPNSPIPLSDRSQYYTAWPSGTGIQESIALFEKEAAKGPVYIATQGTFGLLPYAYEVYLSNNPNVTIKGFWPIERDLPSEIAEAAKVKKTYYVFYQDCTVCPANGVAPPELPLEEVLEIKRLEKNSNFTVYEVIAK